MMRKIVLVVISIMLMVFANGCGKKSGLEGKIVDGKGQPMAGVKVVAKQVQPIKGYEQFENTTGSDGGFKFSKLFPASAYELIPYTEGNVKQASTKMDSGPEGQTKIATEPIAIRFLPSPDGFVVRDTKTGLTWKGDADVVNDPRTGLMWTRNAQIGGKPLNFRAVNGQTAGITIGGKNGWRLPNVNELETFVRIDGGNPPSFLRSVGFSNVKDDQSYWSSTEGPSPFPGHGAFISYYSVDLKSGQKFSSGINYVNCNVILVRSGQ